MTSTAPRFLCDEMFKGLGHWLRIAGYDVLILPDGTPDRKLLERCIADNRLLLTRDQKLLEFKNSAGHIEWLKCANLEDCVRELNSKLNIDWLLHPFSRCKQCNSILTEATESQFRQVPEQARQIAGNVLYCPQCEQLFWDGSHVKRMRGKLKHWDHIRQAAQQKVKE